MARKLRRLRLSTRDFPENLPDDVTRETATLQKPGEPASRDDGIEPMQRSPLAEPLTPGDLEVRRPVVGLDVLKCAIGDLARHATARQVTP
jgi:hypothetical protein